ncbi:MBL fold metallo-hydrolase RNA specificity domain-containing protein [Pseudomonas sp. 5Ae-yellow]|uniref:MBL fold metallo-hydrolase RNA specificity domain-containing protein n=1 Tax=Pseudomonas sp. 5Ae-yellow TaxID=2759848 RepID=UPI0015F3CE0E|nr:MBL fold metallo-hydrolase [Pseudomonas sp. 5Ae-yellow]MBA6420842.1 MBL fold metallo-hydrolase [Pseudomonas sp. 5Ae-yellow]
MRVTYPWIQHHGAVNGVTGSCHQLWLTEDDSLLIDCGLFQGAEVSNGGAGQNSLAIEFALTTVHALIATHVHVDHIGRLPWLLAAGFDQPIHCTEPSALLMPTVLEDAFKVGISRDAALSERYVKKVSGYLQGHPYKKWVTVLERPDLVCRIRFQRAGHILGSAYIECDLHYPLQQRRRRIVFSGDLGAPHAPMLPAPKPPHAADVVVLESTYGDRQHESRRNRRARLQKVLERALADGGSVIVPAFSIGRTQELLYELEGIIQGNKAWQQIPVILDAPLATRFTKLYRELKPWWNAEALKRVVQGHQPLAFKQLLTVTTHAQHMTMVNRLAHNRQPAIVITGSGMCTAGRVINYLKAMLGDARHNVVFVGYQARGTPGHVIQQYGPQHGYVELEGERYTINAGVHTLGGYSAHADQKGLVGFITGMKRWPEEVRLVHGDDQAKATLASELQRRAKAQAKPLRVVIAT